MNTMHLWYFINVAQTRSIRKAAQFCGTSPSTIASALKDLTGEMIVPLYKKTAFGVELTEEGRLLYTSAQNIISKLEQSNSIELLLQWKNKIILLKLSLD